MADGLAVKEGRIIFFSHSLTTYNTPIESTILEFLSRKYPNYHIINPRDIPLDSSWDFDTCMEHILPKVRTCKILVWYKDESFSPGVDAEIDEATRLGLQVLKLEV